MTDFVRFLAAWALVHESADEGWKAAIARGRDQAPGTGGGPEDFVDGLAALVDAEKERLKAELAERSAGDRPAGGGGDVAPQLEALVFELAELRGRVESLQASIDALLARSGD
ncbi:hypothetical protein [Thioalkalivibrio sp. XN8]|uniref:hypothetical protein n=1 Tax=Thioalkalivibrio sp. XN8 TaxID=2712863 RepID=UPI0013ECCA4A|nr:hypothetical protein [Thioalkalivibrio sp. XN8]NGP52279.1 hypothetical protein [Thioalkalivibrio sp. XN8]